MAPAWIEQFRCGRDLRIAGLLKHLAPDGLLCVREKAGERDSELFIIAGTGSHANLMNAPAGGIGDAPVANALQRSFSEGRNVYGVDHAALYFGGNTTRDFAAFINTPAPLDEIEQRLLEVFCRNISVGLDNVLLVSRLHNFAFYDPLTKLPNRTRLKELLDEALTTPKPAEATLALVDIDHFAETNDALGHQYGDLLLLGVAGRACNLSLGDP